MKSIGQLERRKAWLEDQLAKVSAEIKARTPKVEKPGPKKSSSSAAKKEPKD